MPFGIIPPWKRERERERLHTLWYYFPVGEREREITYPLVLLPCGRERNYTPFGIAPWERERENKCPLVLLPRGRRERERERVLRFGLRCCQ